MEGEHENKEQEKRKKKEKKLKNEKCPLFGILMNTYATCHKSKKGSKQRNFCDAKLSAAGHTDCTKLIMKFQGDAKLNKEDGNKYKVNCAHGRG